MATISFKGIGELPYGGSADVFNIDFNNDSKLLNIETEDLKGNKYVLMRGCPGLEEGSAVLYDKDGNTILTQTGIATASKWQGVAFYVGNTLTAPQSNIQAGYFLIQGSGLVKATGVTQYFQLYMTAVPGELSVTGGVNDAVYGLACVSNPIGGFSAIMCYNRAIIGASVTVPPAGILALNGDATPTQVLDLGTTGTDLNIFDNNAGTHTLNVPNAGLGVRGVVSTGAQIFDGDKTFNNNVNINGNTVLGNTSTDTVTINANTAAIPNNLALGNVAFFDETNDRLGLGTLTPSSKLDIVSATPIATSVFKLSNLVGSQNWLIVDQTPEALITAPIGTIANDVVNGKMYYKETGVLSTGWKQIDISLTDDWSILGTSGTLDTINFIGTTDAQDFVTKTNGTERFRVHKTLNKTTFNGNYDLESVIGDLKIKSLNTNTLETASSQTSPVTKLANTTANLDVFVGIIVPENAIVGSIGDLFVDTLLGKLYIKETGTATNTGWKPVGVSLAPFTVVDIAARNAITTQAVGQLCIVDDAFTLTGEHNPETYIWSGTVWVDMASFNLDFADMKDVNLTSPANNETIIYNSTTSQWENKLVLDLNQEFQELNFTGTDIVLPTVPIGNIEVYVNGLRMREGTSEDYTVASNIITFNYNLINDDVLVNYK